MKKTLVVILALSGMAMASDLLTIGNAEAAFTIKDGKVDHINTGNFTVDGGKLTLANGEKWGTDVRDGQVRTTMTVALTFDMTKLSGLDVNSKILTLNDWGVGVNPVAEDKVKFCGRWSNNDIYCATDGFTTEGEVSIVVALRGASNNGTRIFTNPNDTDDYYYTAAGLRGNVNGSTLTITETGLNALTKVAIWNMDAFGEGAVPASAFTALSQVPEPATATLSLLALAGLAARRRRR